MTDPATLLQEYARNGSEEAFRELLARYINLVHSTAIRLVEGDAPLAQDVAQTVFLDLARSARSLPAGVVLGGWLHRHTCFVARNILRAERRRQRRERQAVEMNAHPDHLEAELAQVAPILDEAINQLGEEDRAAILLRFFEHLEFRLIGESLGSTEEAARKRVTRALEKLQSILKREGVTLTAAALGTVLTAQAVTAAPVGMAATIAGPILSGAATATGTTNSFTLLKLMAAHKLQSATITAIVLASALLPLVVQSQARAKLREQDEVLRQRNQLLAQANAEHQRLADLLAQRTSPSPLANAQLREVLRLRNEVGLLKRQGRETTSANATPPQPSEDQLSAMKRKYAAQVERLKQWLDAHPSEKIPELQNLPNGEWIDMVDTLAEDNNFARAASLLRVNAEGEVLQALWSALRKYARNNNGQFPADLSQLNPYLTAPIDDSILQRYEIVPANSLVPELQPGGNWAITQKAPVNPELDGRSAYGLSQMRMADERVTNRWALAQ